MTALAPWSVHDISRTDTLRARLEAVMTARAPAPAFESGDRTLTYAELERRTATIASALGVRRVGEARRNIACVSRDAVELAVAAIAVVRAGHVFVPLDVSRPLGQLQRICEMSGTDAIIGDAGVARSLRANRFVPGDLEADRDAPVPDPPPDAGLVSVTFSSGSTGTPKGVERDDWQWLSSLAGAAEARQLTSCDRIGMIYGGAYSTLSANPFRSTSIGACQLPYALDRHGLHELSTWLNERRITHLPILPSILRLALGSFPPSLKLPALRSVMLTGETVDREDVLRVRRHLTEEAVVVSSYGSVETTGALHYEVTSSTDLPPGPVPLGWPLPGVSVQLVNESGSLVEGMGEGRLRLGARYLTGRYLNEDGHLTFIPPTVEDDRWWFETADLARRRPDGAYEHLGRTDDLIKVGGQRVFVNSVASALRARAGVRDAIVCPRGAEGQFTHLVAFITGDARIDMRELRTELMLEFPAHAVPSSITRLEQLPRLPNGKVDVGSLSRQAVAPGVSGDLPERIAEVMARILGLPAVALDDDFFLDLGGTSLLGARLLAQLHRTFDIDLPLSRLVERGTARKLAALAGGKDLTSWDSLVWVRSGTGPPVVVLHGMDGNVFAAHRITPHLPSDIPVWAFQSPLLQRVPLRDTSVRAMASEYLQRLREETKEPPILFGFSFGGLLAIEIAQQLAAMGEPARGIVLGDTSRPRGASSIVAGLARRRRAHAVYLRGASVRDVARHVGWRLRVRARLGAGAIGQAWSEGVGRPVPPRLQRGSVQRAHIRIGRDYRPEPYAGPVRFIRALRQGDDDELRGWGELLPGLRELVRVDSTHEGLVQEPHVASVAAAVARFLEEE